MKHLCTTYDVRSMTFSYKIQSSYALRTIDLNISPNYNLSTIDNGMLYRYTYISLQETIPLQKVWNKRNGSTKVAVKYQISVKAKNLYKKLQQGAYERKGNEQAIKARIRQRKAEELFWEIVVSHINMLSKSVDTLGRIKPNTMEDKF